MFCRYECTLCGDKFWFTQDLKEHLTNVHARKPEEAEDSKPTVEPVMEEIKFEDEDFKVEDEDFKVEDFTETDSDDSEEATEDDGEDFSKVESAESVSAFKCTSCPKSFKMGHGLRDHVRSAHFGI